jgi:predicted O-methyltransferase YrrM
VGAVEVDDYLETHLVGSDPVLDDVLRACDAAGIPGIEVSPLQGKFLELCARMVGASSVLEFGTLGGYSTIWLARGMRPGGRVVSLEASAEYARVAGANVDRAGFGDIVDIRVGRAAETMLALDGPFDLVFIDADKASTPEYFERSIELARPGTAIVADNVVRGGAIADASAANPSVRGMRRFVELAGADPRVSVTALQTVGAKGHDGFALAVVL